MNEIEIPRWLGYHKQEKCESHGFSDTLEKAYAAVVYMQMVHCLEITQSLSRLKLYGTKLLANLLSKAVKALDIKDTGEV